MNYRTGGDKRLFEVAYSCYNEVVQGQKMFFCGGGNRKIRHAFKRRIIGGCDFDPLFSEDLAWHLPICS